MHNSFACVCIKVLKLSIYTSGALKLGEHMGHIPTHIFVTPEQKGANAHSFFKEPMQRHMYIEVPEKDLEIGDMEADMVRLLQQRLLLEK